MADDNYEAAALAGQAQEAFMTTQMSVARYMATRDPSIATTAKSDFDSYLVTLSQTASRLKDENSKKVAADTGTAGKAFEQALDDLVKQTGALDTLVNTTMSAVAEKANNSLS